MVGTLDVRALLETDDGALIYTWYHGRLDLSQGPGTSPAYAAPLYETGDERYAWLNLIQAVAKGELTDGGSRSSSTRSARCDSAGARLEPAVLLWDFGDTLVDERWMRRPPAACPDWVEVWTEVMDRHADAWNDGSLDDAGVFTALAERAGMTVDAVEVHARACCTDLVPHRAAWRIASERRRPQALVTVNPVMLERWIVPHYGLAAMFDVIVISAAERTADKTRPRRSRARTPRLRRPARPRPARRQPARPRRRVGGDRRRGLLVPRRRAVRSRRRHADPGRRERS